MRNHKGEVKIIFSKAIGEADSNWAEMMAVREAFTIFSASRWKDNYKLLMESNSGNTVKWTTHPDTAPWRMRKVVLQLESLKEGLEGWEIQHARERQTRELML